MEEDQNGASAMMTQDPGQSGRDVQAEAALQAEAPYHTRVNVRLTTSTYDEVCRVAIARRQSCSSVIRAAVSVFLRNLPRVAP
jgi:hypothetical protein